MWRAYESDSDAPSDACDSRILSATLGSLVADPDLRPSACSADKQSPALVAPLSRIDADPQSPLLPVTYTAFIAPCFEMCTLVHRDSYSRRSESPYRAAPHAASSAISSSAHMRMPSCHHAIMPSCHHAWCGAHVSARDALPVQGGSRRRCGVPWRRRRDAERAVGGQQRQQRRGRRPGGCCVRRSAGPAPSRRHRVLRRVQRFRCAQDPQLPQCCCRCRASRHRSEGRGPRIARPAGGTTPPLRRLNIQMHARHAIAAFCGLVETDKPEVSPLAGRGAAAVPTSLMSE